ncbi:hypothetical protein BsWGS_11699 [Bradybaena similaris]
MGQTGSSVSKFITHPLSWFRGTSQVDGTAADTELIPKGAALFVFKRRGSMFFDEDGDLAHEFYCEVKDRRANKVVMKRCKNNLVPQGEVELPFPRLHGDLPVIMFDASNLQLYSSSRV